LADQMRVNMESKLRQGRPKMIVFNNFCKKLMHIGKTLVELCF